MKRTHHTHGSAERLEDRIAPATIPLLDLHGGPTIGTFTDADGDTVTVRIEGHAGKVEFLDAGGNSVNDGENIASVIITGSSADFALTYSLDVAGSAAATVLMGDITANKTLRGVYSIALTNGVGSFQLGSFTGPGFSLGGGLSTDDVLGNADGLGIQVKNLEAGRTINIRNNVIGDLVINGSLAGTINVGGTVQTTSDWLVTKNVAPSAQIDVSSSFQGTFESRGVFAGDVKIGSFADNTWTFKKSVLKSAHLTAEGWENIQASKSWGGQLFSTSTNTTATIGGQILGTSVFSGEGQLTLTVGGGVQSGAAFGFTSDMNVTVGGNLSGTWTGSSDVTMTVSGGMSGASIVSGNDLTLTVDKGINNSRIAPDGDVILNTDRVSSSHLLAATGILANITGSVSNSTLVAASGDLSLSVGGNLTGTTVTAGSEDLVLNVTGSVAHSTLVALESSVQLTIGASITDSEVKSATNLTATIGRDAVRSAFASLEPNATDLTDDVTLTLSGDLIDSQVTADGGLAITTANLKSSSLVSTNASVSAIVTKDMVGSQIAAALNVVANITGKLAGSEITGDEGTAVQIQVGTDVVDSRITGLDQSVNLLVGRNLINSIINSDELASITVAGSVTNLKAATFSDITLTVTGDITHSILASQQSSVTVTVGGNFLSSSVTCDEDMIVSVDGNMDSTANSFDSSITLTVGGTMSGQVIAAGSLIADLGDLKGSLDGSSVDLVVHGNVSSGARIGAGSILDLNNDTVGFRVDGSFGGVINAGSLDSNVIGGSTLVGGDVLKTARINLGNTLGFTADESFSFGGDFLGVLNIGNDIDVNLSFNGDVNQVIIGGIVGTTGAVNTIAITGKLKFLSSGSLFNETASGTAGSFRNGAGTETATLTADGGFKTITPLITLVN